MNRSGRLIKKARKLLAYTQVQLGDKVGMSGQHISNLERGVALPPKKKLRSLASALEVHFIFMKDIVSRDLMDRFK